MTARVAYLSTLTSSALASTVASAGGHGMLRPPRRLFGSLADQDLSFQEELPNWPDAADHQAAGMAPSPAPAGERDTEPPGPHGTEPPGLHGTEPSGLHGTEPPGPPRPVGRDLPAPAETDISGGHPRASGDPTGIAAPALRPGPAAALPGQREQARAATSEPSAARSEPSAATSEPSATSGGHSAGAGAREQAATPGGPPVPALPDATGPRARVSRSVPDVVRPAVSPQPAASGPLPAPAGPPAFAWPGLPSPPPAPVQRAAAAQRPATSGTLDPPAVTRPDRGSPPAAAAVADVPGSGDAGPGPAPYAPGEARSAQPQPQPQPAPHGTGPRQAAPRAFRQGGAARTAAASPPAGQAAGPASDRALEPRAAATLPAATLFPGQSAHARGRGVAPARTPSPTVSIGTIEVTVLAPPRDPQPASAAHRTPREAPGRLSRGLGPRFGQGQT
jgi:hypothetical protein